GRAGRPATCVKDAPRASRTTRALSNLSPPCRLIGPWLYVLRLEPPLWSKRSERAGGEVDIAFACGGPPARKFRCGTRTIASYQTLGSRRRPLPTPSRLRERGGRGRVPGVMWDLRPRVFDAPLVSTAGAAQESLWL